MDKIREFMELVKNDPKGKELVEKLGRPKSDTEAINGYLSIAKDLGFSLTEAELVEGLKDLMREQKNKTEEVSERVSLSEEELNNVAGGSGCESTYEDGEWCWFSDKCDLVITGYYTSDYFYEDPDHKGRDSYYDPRDSDVSDNFELGCDSLADWEVY